MIVVVSQQGGLAETVDDLSRLITVQNGDSFDVRLHSADGDITLGTYSTQDYADRVITEIGWWEVQNLGRYFMPLNAAMAMNPPIEP